jgi:biotin carboxylase
LETKIKRFSQYHLMTQRILMLGASEAQMVAIERAKALGMYVITVDNRPDNPGHALSDAFYNVSTVDIEGIFMVAQKERIDGIISYASDPGALTASVVADRLGLPGDPPHAVVIAQDKLLLREQQLRLGHPIPRFVDADDYNALKSLWSDSSHGLVVKPTDRAGSVGLHIFKSKPSWEQLENAIAYASSQAIKKKVIVESRIQRDGLQFGCDYIFYKGALLFVSYADQYQHITESTEAGIGNLVPSGHTLEALNNATKQICQLVASIGLRSGIYNTDMIVSRGRVYLLDFGARLGGNMLGEVHRLATGVDYTQVAIEIALGKTPSIKSFTTLTNAGHLVLHANSTGILRHLELSPELRKHVVLELRSKIVGEMVNPYRSTRDRLGVVVMQSDDRSALLDIYRDPIPHFNLKIEPIISA